MELPIWNTSECYSMQGVGQWLSQKMQTLLLLRVYWCKITVEYCMFLFLFSGRINQVSQSVTSVRISSNIEECLNNQPGWTYQCYCEKIAIQNTYIYLHTTLPAHAPTNMHTPLRSHSPSVIDALCHDSNVFNSMSNSGKAVITSLKLVLSRKFSLTSEGY